MLQSFTTYFKRTRHRPLSADTDIGRSKSCLSFRETKPRSGAHINITKYNVNSVNKARGGQRRGGADIVSTEA